MRVLVILLSPPLRELVQAVLDGDAAATRLVPRRSLLLRGRAVGFHDDDVGKTKGDVEGAFEELRGGVDLSDDVALGFILVPVEGLDVGAIGGHTHQSDLAGAGTSSSAANRRHQVDTGTISSRLAVKLSLPKERWNRRGVSRAHAGIYRVVVAGVEV